MLQSVIPSEIICILACLILLYGSIFENRERTVRGRWFQALLVTYIICLASDALSWTFDGQADKVIPVFIFSLLSIVLSFAAISVFVGYLTAYIAESGRASVRLLRSNQIFTLLAVAATAVLAATGKLFTAEGGVYEEGPFYPIYLVLNIAALFFCLVIIFYYRKCLSFHDLMVTCIYIFIPAFGALINMFVPEWAYTYQLGTLSLLLFYVMLQSEHVGKLQLEKEISRHYAYFDELTGLHNRRAFTEKMQQIGTKEGSAGILFGDVNALKYTNDHFGHLAGDEKIRSFAELLKKYFPSEDICRISGDEFAVFGKDTDEAAFSRSCSKVQKELESEQIPSACIGWEYGKCSEIDSALKRAEIVMYRRKEIFYAAHPELGR